MSEIYESPSSQQQPVGSREAEAIATLGYIYGYPLVLMDATRAAMSSTPANQFDHRGALPDDAFTEVVSPNVDTLYSSAWLDLGREPIVLAVPDMGKRYYTMPMLDAWTNVVASPGTRTTGNGKGAYALVGPGWRGDLPTGVEAIQSPTDTAWLIGRTYTAGKKDYEAVHGIQRQYQLVPLRAWGKPTTPPKAAGVPAGGESRTPPVKQVEKLDAGAFFARLAQLMEANPPTANDDPILDRLALLGIAPGEAFDLGNLPPSIADAVEGGVAAARARLQSAQMSALGKPVNGWRIQLDLGRYGTNYEQRALVALMGLGANLAEDAVYPGTETDAAGQPLSGSHRYVLRFPPGAQPPVKGFWSLTMYTDQHFLAANPIGRYALGDRDPLRAEADGSLEIVIQHADPGPERQSNWLPAPDGGFNLIMRLYYPKGPVLDGKWYPPAVVRV